MNAKEVPKRILASLDVSIPITLLKSNIRDNRELTNQVDGLMNYLLEQKFDLSFIHISGCPLLFLYSCPLVLFLIGQEGVSSS